MSYIIVTRNPRNKKLAIVDDGDDNFPTPMEFQSAEDAIAAAIGTTACMAWGYELVEITK